MRAKGLWALGGTERSRTLSRRQNGRCGPGMTTDESRGVCRSVLKLRVHQEDIRWVCQGQNRTREIRPSGIVGRLAES